MNVTGAEAGCEPVILSVVIMSWYLIIIAASSSTMTYLGLDKT